MHSSEFPFNDLNMVSPFLWCMCVCRFSLDLIPVSYVMHSPVVVLRQTMKVRVGQEGMLRRHYTQLATSII